MKGSCWKALKMLILLQEKTRDIDLCFIHFLLNFFLFLIIEPFGLPPLMLLEEINLKSDVWYSLLSASASSLSSSWFLLVLWLCLIAAQFILSYVIHGLTEGVSLKKKWQLVSRNGHLFHFRGLILCNAQRLQFHRNKKGERKGTSKKVFYFPTSSFFNLMELLLLFALHSFFLIATAPLSFLMVAG